MKRMTFKATDKDGNEVEYEVIATYEDEETNKSYIVYTDKTFNENNNLKIYASLYKMNGENIKLFELENKDDKEIVEELIKEVVNSLSNISN